MGRLEWRYVYFGCGVHVGAVLDLINYKGTIKHVDRHQISGSWGVTDFIQ
jgi:hypothetical protein